MLNNKIYDILKYIAQIVLPALATLYLALAGIWNLPYGEAISGTVMAIDTFLGAILMLSSTKYNKKGEQYMEDNEEIVETMELAEQDNRGEDNE